MIMSQEHEALHFAAQEVCNGLKKEEYAALNERARVALTQLAIYAGCTNVEWWPEWAPTAAEIAEKTAQEWIEHEWVMERNGHRFDWPVCAKCGMVQRHDKKNGSCKGPRGLSLRSTGPQIPGTCK